MGHRGRLPQRIQVFKSSKSRLCGLDMKLRRLRFRRPWPVRIDGNANAPTGVRADPSLHRFQKPAYMFNHRTHEKTLLPRAMVL